MQIGILFDYFIFLQKRRNNLQWVHLNSLFNIFKSFYLIFVADSRGLLVFLALYQFLSKN